MTHLDDNKLNDPLFIETASAHIKTAVNWIKFIAIVGMLVGICFFIGLVLLGGAYSSGINPMFKNLVSLVVLVFGIFYLYYSISLFIYANKLTRLLQTPSVDTLIKAFKEQKSYWVSYGIILSGVVVLFGIILLLLVAGLN